MKGKERHTGKRNGTQGSKDRQRPAAARTERWKHKPDSHDYPAAAEYLSLVMEEALAAEVVAAMEQAPMVHRLAKDLLRASRLPALPEDNVHVAADLAKVRAGELLSPVLLVRGDAGAGVALTVADGYHRICASYLLDENAPIPCHLVDPAVGPSMRDRTAGAAERQASGPANT